MRRYEEFAAWKLLNLLHAKVYAMTSKPPAVHDYRYRDNLRDAVDSAQRNFPEGFGRFGPKEFARFLDHSRASLLETKNGLQVGLMRGYFRERDVRDADRLTRRALGAISSLQRYLRSRRAEDNARHIRDNQQAINRGPGDEESTNPEPTNPEPTNPEPTNPRTDEPTNPTD